MTQSPLIWLFRFTNDFSLCPTLHSTIIWSCRAIHFSVLLQGLTFTDEWLVVAISEGSYDTNPMRAFEPSVHRGHHSRSRRNVFLPLLPPTPPPPSLKCPCSNDSTIQPSSPPSTKRHQPLIWHAHRIASLIAKLHYFYHESRVPLFFLIQRRGWKKILFRDVIYVIRSSKISDLRHWAPLARIVNNVENIFNFVQEDKLIVAIVGGIGKNTMVT